MPPAASWDFCSIPEEKSEGKGLRDDFYDRIGNSQRAEKDAGERKHSLVGEIKDNRKGLAEKKSSLMKRIRQNQEKLKEDDSRKPMKLAKSINQERQEL